VYGIYLTVVGVMTLAGPKLMAEGQYLALTGGELSSYLAESAAAAGLLLLTFQAFAAMLVLVGVFKMFIALFPFRKGEKWSWWVLLVIGVIAYGFMVPYSFIIGSMMTIAVTVIALILWLIALLVPARAMLSAKQ